MAKSKQIIEKLKTPQAEASFSLLYVVFLFIIIPMLPLGKYGGGVAMFVGSLLGLAVYGTLYRESLRAAKWVLVGVAIVAVVVAVIVGALSHGR